MTERISEIRPTLAMIVTALQKIPPSSDDDQAKAKALLEVAGEFQRLLNEGRRQNPDLFLALEKEIAGIEGRPFP